MTLTSKTLSRASSKWFYYCTCIFYRIVYFIPACYFVFWSLTTVEAFIHKKKYLHIFKSLFFISDSRNHLLIFRNQCIEPSVYSLSQKCPILLKCFFGSRLQQGGLRWWSRHLAGLLLRMWLSPQCCLCHYKEPVSTNVCFRVFGVHWQARDTHYCEETLSNDFCIRRDLRIDYPPPAYRHLLFVETKTALYRFNSGRKAYEDKCHIWTAAAQFWLLLFLTRPSQSEANKIKVHQCSPVVAMHHFTYTEYSFYCLSLQNHLSHRLPRLRVLTVKLAHKHVLQSLR